MQLEPLLPKLYKELHDQGAFQGTSWSPHLPELVEFLLSHGSMDEPVLDYGCGPKGGLRVTGLTTVVSYDPYVPLYALDPWVKPITTFFSCDVLEHMPLADIKALLQRICKQQTIKLIYLAITARLANKTFSTGHNVHLTVAAPEWWQGFLETSLAGQYEITKAHVDLLQSECVFAFVQKDLECR